MTALPDHAASPLMTRLQDELRTESVRSQAREQFTGAVDRIFDTAESVCIASVARTVLRAVRDSVVSVAYSALFDHGLASKSDQRFASIRSTGNLTFSTAF